MTIHGLDLLTGMPVELEAGSHIRTVAIRDNPTLPCLAPAFIDIQVNGYAGVDFSSPEISLEQIARSIRALYATGVSRFFPTVITSSPAGTLSALRKLATAANALPEGESIAGLHVEGPFISAEDGPRGAHPREWVRAADIDEYRRWKEAAGGLLRLITLAPECPGALALIERIAGDGLVAAIGHTAASVRKSTTPRAPEPPYRLISAMEPMRPCPGIPITSGINSRTIAWQPVSSPTESTSPPHF